MFTTDLRISSRQNGEDTAFHYFLKSCNAGSMNTASPITVAYLCGFAVSVL
jgi:hypothetical protein